MQQQSLWTMGIALAHTHMHWLLLGYNFDSSAEAPMWCSFLEHNFAMTVRADPHISHNTAGGLWLE
jgi:hypothetical protein